MAHIASSVNFLLCGRMSCNLAVAGKVENGNAMIVMGFKDWCGDAFFARWLTATTLATRKIAAGAVHDAYVV
jgi:hypothetical protein